MKFKTGRYGLILLLPLANTGCGMGFFYNNLDRLVRWELDSVLAMTPDQEAFFEAEFAALWRWHRTEELPRYAEDLDRWAERYKPERQLWADYRRRWQSDLFILLERRHEVDHFTAGFERLVKDQKTYYGEGFAEVEAANEALVKSALVAVLNQAPPEQRQRLRDTLSDRAEDLRTLAAGGQDA